jgi:hypothetical protein
MTPEEWLRARGIDISRQGMDAAQPGALAGQHTSALPSVPDDDDEPENLDTQLVPTVVRIDLRLGGDVAEWPTAALIDPSPTILDEDEDAALLDERDDDFDYAIENEMTVPLPAIPTRSVATPPPTPSFLLDDADDADEISGEADADGDDGAPPGDITTTPTRRLDG